MAPVEVTEDANEYNNAKLHQLEAETEAALEELDKTKNKIKEMEAAIEAFRKCLEVELRV